MANSSIDFVNDGYYPSEPVKQEQGDYAKTVFLSHSILQSFFLLISSGNSEFATRKNIREG